MRVSTTFSSMNNNLIREQRLDKNGQLNTKLVRASKPQTLSAKVPAPAPPATKKKLTAAQKRPRTRVVPYSAPGNYELSQQLCTDYHNDNIKVTASDEEFYSVLSITSSANAFTLLQAGYRTADEAANYLTDNGFEELLQDNTALCEEALARKIPPHKFIQAGVDLRGPESSDHYFDALEVFCSSIPDTHHENSNRILSNKVYDGLVDLADIKAIGFKEASECRHKDVLFNALEKIKAGTANYTPDEFKLIMSKHPTYTRDAYDFADKYGTDLVLSVDSLDVQLVDYLETHGASKDHTIAMLKYSSQINQAELANNVYREPLTYDKLEKCHTLGLDPVTVATEDYTDQQLDGLLAGIAPAMTSGWL